MTTPTCPTCGRTWPVTILAAMCRHDGTTIRPKPEEAR